MGLLWTSSGIDKGEGADATFPLSSMACVLVRDGQVLNEYKTVVANIGMIQNEACHMVCGDEFPDICGSQCASNQCNNGPLPLSPSPPTGGGLSPKSFNESLNAQLIASGKPPYLFNNKLRYNDSEIYIAVVGRVGSNLV